MKNTEIYFQASNSISWVEFHQIFSLSNPSQETSLCLEAIVTILDESEECHDLLTIFNQLINFTPDKMKEDTSNQIEEKYLNIRLLAGEKDEEPIITHLWTLITSTNTIYHLTSKIQSINMLRTSSEVNLCKKVDELKEIGEDEVTQVCEYASYASLYG